MIRLPALGANPQAPFPSPTTALRDPDGLLAMGGDLSVPRLINAYAHGIFPWFSDGQPILWWSPDPRMVLRPQALHVSRSLRKHLRRCDWQVRLNTSFDQVIRHCARTPRRGQGGTWITASMQAAYRELHRAGFAHSVEVISHEGELIGGIYGVALGTMFFGESMFSLRDNASKVAIAALCRALTLSGGSLLDGQVESDHLARLGFAPCPREAFLDHCRREADPARPWRIDQLDPAQLQPAALAEAWRPAPAETSQRAV